MIPALFELENKLPDSESLVKNYLSKKERALCDSRNCILDLVGRHTLKSKNGYELLNKTVEKFVKRGERWCPDCGYALRWVR